MMMMMTTTVAVAAAAAAAAAVRMSLTRTATPSSAACARPSSDLSGRRPASCRRDDATPQFDYPFQWTLLQLLDLLLFSCLFLSCARWRHAVLGRANVRIR
jgi:hypothetical protein